MCCDTLLIGGNKESICYNRKNQYSGPQFSEKKLNDRIMLNFRLAEKWH